MTQLPIRPVIVVLCATVDHRPGGMESIEARADVRYVDAHGLGDALAGADALFLWDFFSTAVRDAWPRVDRLRWIHVAAAGVDKLLFPELADSGVVVTNARGIFDRPIAEFVLASILAYAKDLYTSSDLQRDKTWRHRETLRVAGRAALIVGTGGIGRETARLLRAVGLEVRGAGRAARVDDHDFDSVVASSELVDHVGWADHVVIAAPLTAQTTGLIDARVLAAMKPTAQLINIGRGPIIDEDALAAALRKGQLAAAALDVFGTEPLPQDHPLWTMPGVVISPHMSGDTVGWMDELAAQFVRNATLWLDGEPVFNVMDKHLGFVPSAQPADPESANTGGNQA